jgi:hypothetical protein
MLYHNNYIFYPKQVQEKSGKNVTMLIIQGINKSGHYI